MKSKESYLISKFWYAYLHISNVCLPKYTFAHLFYFFLPHRTPLVLTEYMKKIRIYYRVRWSYFLKQIQHAVIIIFRNNLLLSSLFMYTIITDRHIYVQISFLRILKANKIFFYFPCVLCTLYLRWAMFSIQTGLLFVWEVSSGPKWKKSSSLLKGSNVVSLSKCNFSDKLWAQIWKQANKKDHNNFQ